MSNSTSAYSNTLCMQVYTEIREEGHYPNVGSWGYIYGVKLANSNLNSTDKNYGYVSKTNIGEGSTMNARGVFQFPYQISLSTSKACVAKTLRCIS